MDQMLVKLKTLLRLGCLDTKSNNCRIEICLTQTDTGEQFSLNTSYLIHDGDDVDRLVDEAISAYREMFRRQARNADEAKEKAEKTVTAAESLLGATATELTG